MIGLSGIDWTGMIGLSSMDNSVRGLGDFVSWSSIGGSNWGCIAGSNWGCITGGDRSMISSAMIAS
jgi:hypothetical protein